MVAPETNETSEEEIDTSGLSVLGRTVREPIRHLECFTAPRHVTDVRFTTDELMSVCPITGQPDISSLVIEYRPDRLCIESKSLKLYLWSFRDRKVFCEALAAEIAGEVLQAAAPEHVRVVVTQHPRGGIVTQATAERSASRRSGGEREARRSGGERETG